MKKLLVVLGLVILVGTAYPATVRLTNNTGGYDIWYVYMSSTSDTDWGGDWLGDEILYSGETYSFTVPDGDYDIKLIDEDGDEYIRWEVPVTGTYSWNVTLDDLGEATVGTGPSVAPVVGTGSAPVTISNDLGDWTIYYAYCSPSSHTTWGDDRLGSEIISPGESFTFYVQPGIDYDIQLEDEDGDTYTRFDVPMSDSGYYWAVTLDDLD